MVLAYITCRDSKEANNIAMQLLDMRLIACANIFPIKSMYWWKGKIEKSREHVLIAKVSEPKFEALEKEVKKLHSYSIPCILRINSKANTEFDNWLKKETA